MKLIDFQISDDILKIVQEEVERIRTATERDGQDMLILEKATKIFTMIQSNTREAIKAGMLGNTSEDDLNSPESLEGGVNSPDSDDQL